MNQNKQTIIHNVTPKSLSTNIRYSTSTWGKSKEALILLNNGMVSLNETNSETIFKVPISEITSVKQTEYILKIVVSNQKYNIIFGNPAKYIASTMITGPLEMGAIDNNNTNNTQLRDSGIYDWVHAFQKIRPEITSVSSSPQTRMPIHNVLLKAAYVLVLILIVYAILSLLF